MNKVFIFVGIILMAVGAIFAMSSGGVRINHQLADAHTATVAKHLVGGGVAILGAVFIVLAVFSGKKHAAQMQRNLYITQHGIDTQGTVTFVDKNFALLVNNTPIYSILEYTYQDNAGNSHVRRIPNFNSAVLIRKQIQVGSVVSIKYLAENPQESVIML